MGIDSVEVDVRLSVVGAVSSDRRPLCRAARQRIHAYEQKHHVETRRTCLIDSRSRASNHWHAGTAT